MNRAYWYCLFGTATLGLCHCSSPASSRGSHTPAQPAGKADYSLTQRSSSQPNRNGKATAATEPMDVPGRCDVELCEGDLSATAVAELRAAAVKARDCYERELKEKNQLEGKMMVRLRLAAGREPCEIRIERSDLASSESFVKCVLDRLRETTAQPTSGCIDLALPLAFVRQEVESTPDGGVPELPPPKKP